MTVRAWCVVIAGAFCIASPAFGAERAPALVMPNGRGIPPLVDGFDVTGAVIEGDWGLDRPGAGTVVVHPRLLPLYELPEPAGYFPATGRRPPYGRYEVLSPRRRLPRPAESFHRSWSSDASGVLLPAAIPAEPPPVIVANPPQRWQRGERHRRRQRP